MSQDADEEAFQALFLESYIYTSPFAELAVRLERLILFSKTTQKASLLTSLNSVELFDVGLHSRLHWDAIAEFLKHETIAMNQKSNVERLQLSSPFQLTPYETQSEVFPLGKLCDELKSMVFGCMSVRDLHALASTCHLLHVDINNLIEGKLKKAIRHLGLHWSSLRFALEHTGSYIAGLWAAQFALSLEPSFPALEIYSDSKDKAKLLRYFAVATCWQLDTTTRHSRLYDVMSLSHPNKTRFPNPVIIYFCNTSARECLFYQPTTSHFSSISAVGIEVPYADLTLSGRSIVQHVRFAHDRSISATAHSSAIHGFTVVPYHQDGPRNGVCTGQLTCPGTFRCSADVTTFYMPFRSQPWGCFSYEPPNSTVVWSLGAKNCSSTRYIVPFTLHRIFHDGEESEYNEGDIQRDGQWNASELDIQLAMHAEELTHSCTSDSLY